MFFFIFSTIFLGNVSRSKNNSVRYSHKQTDVFM